MKKMVSFFVAVFMYAASLTGIANAQGTSHLRGVMISPSVQANDLQVLGQSWNVNFVRWQLNWEGDKANTATLDDYDAWLESALTKLDSLLPVCTKYGIKVLIDLHSLPGGSDSSGNSRILQDVQSQNHFLQMWNKISRRYAGNSTVWGYDLANEPASVNVPSGLLDWHQLATNAAQNIRVADSTHTIVVEPLLWGKANGFTSFTPLPSSIPNVVYSFHMYYPNEFTHQRVVAPYSGVIRYPGVVNKVMWNKAQLARSLQPAFDFQNKYGVRLFVGEFSAVRWAPAGSAYNYLKDVIDIFEANGWDWTYHAFREYNGWSAEHTENINDLNVAKKQTSREKLLRSWFNKNIK